VRGAMATSTVSWRQRSTGGHAGVHAGAHGLFSYDMLPPLAPSEVLEQKLVASPRVRRDGDTELGYGGNVNMTRLRPPVDGDRTGCGGIAFGRGTRARRPHASYFHIFFMKLN
jgi:hypothetical protein